MVDSESDFEIHAMSDCSPLKFTNTTYIREKQKCKPAMGIYESD